MEEISPSVDQTFPKGVSSRSSSIDSLVVNRSHTRPRSEHKTLNNAIYDYRYLHLLCKVKTGLISSVSNPVQKRQRTTKIVDCMDYRSNSSSYFQVQQRFFYRSFSDLRLNAVPRVSRPIVGVFLGVTGMPEARGKGR